MPISSTRAFVLSVTAFGEQDKMVHLLTEKRGVLKAIAPGSLKGKNRFGSMLELFTEAEFYYYWKESREIITLSKGDLIQSHFHIVSDAYNIFHFYLIAEILLKFLPPSHKDPRVYRLVNAVLKSRRQGVAIEPLLLYFLVWILRIEGLMFNPRICYNCYGKPENRAWLKSDFRGILCHKCKGDEALFLNQIELDWLERSEAEGPEKVESWGGKIDQEKMIRIFIAKIGYHAECSFKSTQYLSFFR